VSPLIFIAASNADTDEWVKAWKLVTTQGMDLMSHNTFFVFGSIPMQFPQISSNLQSSQLMQTKA